MRALLDINVPIAVLDKDHIHHKAAHHWQAVDGTQGRASCPLTENGVVRIMSSATYCKRTSFDMAEIARRLRVFISDSNHKFWPDGISLLDATRFNLRAVLSPLRLTDACLLALAVEKGGCHVTFDRNIPGGAVLGATRNSLLVLPSNPVTAP